MTDSGFDGAVCTECEEKTEKEELGSANLIECESDTNEYCDEKAEEECTEETDSVLSPRKGDTGTDLPDGIEDEGDYETDTEIDNEIDNDTEIDTETDAEIDTEADASESDGTSSADDSESGEYGTQASRDEYYANLIEEDSAAIRREFCDLPEDFRITDLKDPLRFGALRDLGLSPIEAYLAVGGRKRSAPDNRAHLTPTVPRGAVSRASDIPRSELRIARSALSDISEGELQKLYRRVCGR